MIPHHLVFLAVMLGVVQGCLAAAFLSSHLHLTGLWSAGTWIGCSIGGILLGCAEVGLVLYLMKKK